MEGTKNPRKRTLAKGALGLDGNSKPQKRTKLATTTVKKGKWKDTLNDDVLIFEEDEGYDPKRVGLTIGLDSFLREISHQVVAQKKKGSVCSNASTSNGFNDQEDDYNAQVIKTENQACGTTGSGALINDDDDICIVLDKSRLWHLEDVVSEQTNIQRNIARNVIKLFDQDCTIPFIARYRREMTDGLDAEKLREVQEVYSNVKVVKKKVETVANTLRKEHKLYSDLATALSNATTLSEVENLYAPFKAGSKKSLAEKARQLGLEESALKIIFNQAGPMEFNPSNYVNKAIKDLDSPEKVCLGWQRIMADVISKDPKILDCVKSFYDYRGIELNAWKSATAQKEDDEANSQGKPTKNFKFENYFDWKKSIAELDSHHVLALNRGETLKVLTVKINVPENVKNKIFTHCQKNFPHNYTNPVMQKLYVDTLEDSYQRLLHPLICRHVRSDLTKKAEKESVRVFCSNLKQLLLTPPFRGHNVLGIDPGFAHGCKLAIVSPKGEVLYTEVLYLHTKKNLHSDNAFVIRQCLQSFNVETIALGNGTACRETESFLSNLIKQDYFKPLKLHYSIVDESGVSVYSVSKDAVAELPNMDPNLRSAVGLARRLQDPLLEYVKIDPKHLGVGQYQHDIPETMLKTALDEVMIECVSFVGADLNVSSERILCKVSGLTAAKAKSIVQWREANGYFKNRQQLLKVKGLGPKTFEQCAGFVKIIPQTARDLFEAKTEAKKNSKKAADDDFNPLDMTVIHPEAYQSAETFLSILDIPKSEIGTESTIRKVEQYLKEHAIASLADMLAVPLSTMQLIGDALKQSVSFDIRSDYGEPLFKTSIMLLEDIQVGQKLTGRVQNITTFGSFVDIGVGESGLIHKSNMNHQTLSLGERVEVQVLSFDLVKRRLALKLLHKGVPKLGSEDQKSVDKTSASDLHMNCTATTSNLNHKNTSYNNSNIENRPSSTRITTDYPTSRENTSYNNSNIENRPSSTRTTNDHPKSREYANFNNRPILSDQLYLGQNLQGVVNGVQPYGAFINLEIGCQDGLIHRSQMGGASFLRIGDRVEVQISSLNNNRIGLRLTNVLQ